MKNLKGLLAAVLLLAVAPPAARADSGLNWAVNGDFTEGDGWTGSLLTQPGRDGKPAATLENLKPTWTECDQKIVLPQPAPPVIEISGWLKTDNVVKGPNDWEMARITVVFYDAQGNRLGDWPAPVVQIQ